MHNTKTKMDITFDHKAPSIVVKIPTYCNGYKNILDRGAKIRCITEVTAENIQYCKELLNLVSELRHLDGLKGDIAINESEYMATTVLQKEQPLTEVIYSNVEEVVGQGQYTFDTLWKNSISADKRIEELELGVQPKKTEVLENKEEISKKLLQIIKEAKYLHIYSTINGMHFSYNHYMDINKKITNEHRRGRRGGISWITSIIDKNDIGLVKLFMKSNMKIKHIADIPSISFVISDKYFASTTEKMVGRNMISNLLVSNDPLYLEHFSTIFDNIWDQSVEAKDRISELENTNLFKAKILSSPGQSLKLINQLYNSAQNEILILLPSSNALLRTINSGHLEKLNELGLKGITIKILMIQSHRVNRLKEVELKYPHIEFRMLQFDFPILLRITIIDRIKTIIIKIKDDTKSSFASAIGITSFIEGEPTAWSYTAIFDTLWEQTSLFEKIKKINHQLQSHERMQKEYLDMMAHELRTPIQPIIGLTEYVKGKLKDKKQIELLDSVIASGQKLNTLTENILDISRMEDNFFSIKKERFDLSKSISNIIKIFDNLLKKSKKNIKFEFNNTDKVCFIVGDRTRIEQVISNLVHNSIKSISRKDNKKVGLISIKIEKTKRKSTKLKGTGQMIEAVIEDNGEGINPQVIPNLFTKFTKSVDGNGLGLYISKKIIEAHNGTISARNSNKSGAKFSFSLPISN